MSCYNGALREIMENIRGVGILGEECMRRPFRRVIYFAKLNNCNHIKNIKKLPGSIKLGHYPKPCSLIHAFVHPLWEGQCMIVAIINQNWNVLDENAFLTF